MNKLVPCIQPVNQYKFLWVVTNNIIDRLFDTTLQRFQQTIKTSIKKGGSEFTHESVALLYYYFQKIDIRRGDSYIASPNWLANKEATINQTSKK